MNVPMLMLKHVNPAAKPVVFEHNGQVYARTQDIAAYFGREHEGMVRLLERVLKQQSQLIGQSVFEDHHQSNHGWTIRSYWLTYDGFQELWGCFGGRKSRKNFTTIIPYLEAFDAKEAELQARPGVIATPIEAENPSFMTERPPWFSPTLEKKLSMANKIDDPIELKHLMVDAIDCVVIWLGKVRDVDRDHHFIVHELTRLIGLDHDSMRKDEDPYSDA